MPLPTKFLVPALLAATIAIPASPAADWPHWRGEKRDGSSADSSGWEDGAWPPAEVWRANAGIGPTSPIVAGDQLFVLGWANGMDRLACLDAATGREIWAQEYAQPAYGRFAIGDQNFYQGPTSTPEYDAATGWLYTLGTDGDLICWDAKAGGKRVWAVNFYEAFKVPQRPQVTGRNGSHRDYGYTSSPFVFRDWVICEVGAKDGNLIALDKRTGKVAWRSDNGDPAGHTGGPVPMVVEGVPCLAVLTALHLTVTRIDGANAGKTVAAYPWATDFINNIPCPAAEGNEVLVTSKYNRMAMAKLRISLRGGATKVWEVPHASGVCTPIIHDGAVYFANRGFHCLDFQTGKERWSGGKVGDAASILLAGDGRLICWANDGDLTLVENAARSPSRYQELAAVPRVLNDMAWPHITLANGRLYAKDRGGNLVCFALSKQARALAKAAAPAAPAPDPAGAKAAGAIDPGKFRASADRLLLGWQPGSGKALLGGVAKAAGRYRIEELGAAKIGDAGIALGGGGIYARGLGNALADAAKPLRAFAIEAAFTPENLTQNGPARIITFSDGPYARNFTLGQEGDTLVLRLRTPSAGENGQQPEVQLCKLTAAGQPLHLIVSYRSGEVACFLNGAPAGGSRQVTGGFDGWTPQHFLLGDEYEGGRDWQGTLHGFALYGKFIDAAEAAKRAAAMAAK
ncbi:MAG: PQQ-binding-like beta-propeller repeat protein [Verrucomicrobiales bacterium]